MNSLCVIFIGYDLVWFFYLTTDQLFMSDLMPKYD